MSYSDEMDILKQLNAEVKEKSKIELGFMDNKELQQSLNKWHKQLDKCMKHPEFDVNHLDDWDLKLEQIPGELLKPYNPDE